MVAAVWHVAVPCSLVGLTVVVVLWVQDYIGRCEEQVVIDLDELKDQLKEWHRRGRDLSINDKRAIRKNLYKYVYVDCSAWFALVMLGRRAMLWCSDHLSALQARFACRG